MCVLCDQAGRWGSCPRRAAPEEAGELGIPGQAVLAVTQGCLLAPVPCKGFLVHCTGFFFFRLLIISQQLNSTFPQGFPCSAEPGHTHGHLG